MFLLKLLCFFAERKHATDNVETEGGQFILFVLLWTLILSKIVTFTITNLMN